MIVSASDSPIYTHGKAQTVASDVQFHALLRGGYTQLLDSGDRALLPLLSHFQELSSFHRSTAPAPRLQDVKHYYDGLIHKYLPGGCLQF